MKTYIILVFTIVALWSCETSPEERKALLPDSTGQLTELVVVVDTRTADSLFKERVSDVFRKRIEGHPPPGEAMFSVLFADETFFQGFFQKHRNIIVLLNLENIERLKKILPTSTLDKLVSLRAKKPGTFGVLQEDVFAKNQKMFYVLANNKAEMDTVLQESRYEILELALKHENITGKRKLLGTRHPEDDVFYQKCIKEKNFGIRKPESYRIAIDNEELVWLRKSSTTSELEQGLLMYEAPYRSIDDLSTDSLLKFRNEWVKKYIPGEIEGSYMKYSDALTPVRKDQDFKEKFGVEIRGWWDVEGDFMGGPSYIRAVVDESRGRIVFAEGFVFYPNEDKARPMRELEILVNTLSIK